MRKEKKEKRLQFLLRDERGAAMVEFAFSGALFFALLFCTLVACIFCYRTLSLQFIAANTVRQAKLGGFTVAQVETLAINRARNFGIALNPGDVNVCSAIEYRPTTMECCPDVEYTGTYCRNNIETIGNPGGFVVVAIRTPSPLWFIRDISARPAAGTPGEFRLHGFEERLMFIAGQAAGKIEYPT